MSDPNLNRDKTKKPYSIEVLELPVLVGRTVSAAYVNGDKDVVKLETNKGNLWLTWVGDCCARCYLAHVSGIANLINATISAAKNAEWTDKTEESCEVYDVTETMGTKLTTNKGYVDLESRVEHNGYYGGKINIHAEHPVDQYDNALELPTDLTPLGDF